MKKVFWFVLLIVCLTSAVVIVLLSRTSAKGVVFKKQTVEPVKTVAEKLNYLGQNIKFSYLSKYKLEVIPSEDKNLIDSLRLTSNGAEIVSITISLRNHSLGVLEEVSGVKLRQVKKDEYVQQNFIWNGNSGLLFTKAVPYEMTAFFVSQGRSLTVSMTANSNDVARYGEEYKELVNSITLIP